MPRRVCIGCKYFAQCGSTTRTKPCNGKEIKSKRKSKEW